MFTVLVFQLFSNLIIVFVFLKNKYTTTTVGTLVFLLIMCINKYYFYSILIFMVFPPLEYNLLDVPEILTHQACFTILPDCWGLGWVKILFGQEGF